MECRELPLKCGTEKEKPDGGIFLRLFRCFRALAGVLPSQELYFPDEQFEEVLEKIREADVLVVGSPLYWHNICGSVRDLLDRCCGPVSSGAWFTGSQVN